ncbi:hypothetical protein [Croceivirga lutea]|uniref:hypothetical protein n=1 Tax=Croceivirga lutea TaxID=1775167 RepID=UPI00166895D4|nr:hypothetical protein [Croceivirga lutea]
MENSRLGTRILMEMEKLIDDSMDQNGFPLENYQEFHKQLLKNHYRAACITIDYNRHRIKMDVIINEEDYNPSKLNMVLSTVPVNIFFENLRVFLKSTMETDVKSLAFYARLLQTYTQNNVALLAV